MLWPYCKWNQCSPPSCQSEVTHIKYWSLFFAFWVQESKPSLHSRSRRFWSEWLSYLWTKSRWKFASASHLKDCRNYKSLLQWKQKDSCCATNGTQNMKYIPLLFRRGALYSRWISWLCWWTCPILHIPRVLRLSTLLQWSFSPSSQQRWSWSWHQRAWVLLQRSFPYCSSDGSLQSLQWTKWWKQSMWEPTFGPSSKACLSHQRTSRSSRSKLGPLLPQMHFWFGTKGQSRRICTIANQTRGKCTPK